MKSAIIDIGSNSVRYALLDENQPLPAKKLLRTVQLGRGLSLSGALAEDRMDAAEKVILEFVSLANKSGADEMLIFATEAVRSAKNGNEFAARIAKSCGVRVDVLSGSAEAEIGYLGAAEGGDACVLDVGGASVELTCGKNGKIETSKSLPIGCLRLKDRFAKDYASLEAYLKEVAKEFPKPDSDLPVIGIGGTATSVAAMATGGKTYDPSETHLKFVAGEQIKRLLREALNSTDIAAAFPCLTASRAEIIIYGLYVTLAALDASNKGGYTVSEADNIEGYYKYKHKFF